MDGRIREAAGALQLLFQHRRFEPQLGIVGGMLPVTAAAVAKDGAGRRYAIRRRIVDGDDAAALKMWLALQDFCGDVLTWKAETGEGDEVTDPANGFAAVGNAGEGEVYCLAIASQTRRAFGGGVGLQGRGWLYRGSLS